MCDTDVTISLPADEAWRLMWLLSPLPDPVAERVHGDLNRALSG